MKNSTLLWFLLWFLMLGSLACGEPGARQYRVRGVVNGVEPELAQLVVAHEDIPGFMDGMTMGFDVADPALLEGLERGQEIDFVLEVTASAYRIVSVEVVGEGEPGAGAPRASDSVGENEPAPAFALIDQSGRAVALSDLRGKVLLMDFIYTSCPGPCPIQSGVHVRVQRDLPANLRDRVHFVSISIDPDRDDPAALRAYAEAHGADLSGWSFLTGDRDTVADMIGRYHVGVVPGENQELMHMPITYLIDAEGGIVKRYVGTTHTAEELGRDLVRQAS